jgi:hypothetical protein
MMHAWLVITVRAPSLADANYVALSGVLKVKKHATDRWASLEERR